METAQKILTNLKEPLSFNEKSLQVSFSSGIALFPDQALDFRNLIKNANTAMHWAKDSEHIRNCYFTESMFLALERRMQIETELRSAIQNREMFLLYQPQIQVEKETLHGLEALIRWNHPVMGFVSPSEFIPVAESTGQIESLGLFALEESLRFIKRNEEAGYTDFKISINISIKQMYKEDFVPQILNLTKAACVSPKRFTIEMTESVLMEDAQAMQSKIRDLCAAGFTLALDDFGSGYSSLTYLQYLPVHYIKMDKLFIDGMFNSEKTKK